MSRPAFRCPGCGHLCKDRHGACGPCRTIGLDTAVGLPPGRWVSNGRGVVVYRETTTGHPINRNDQDAA